jgi:riboflavin-specific deaminase-like protein
LIEKPDMAAEAVDHLRRHGLPLVTLTWAQSVDGSTALAQGRRANLSGAESLRVTHELRAAHQVILVGIGTVLADDPLLTVRYAAGEDPQPVILDTRLRYPPSARMLRDNPRKPWIFAGAAAPGAARAELEARGAEVRMLPCDAGGHLDLRSLLRHLAERGVTSVMVEGGATVITSFLSLRMAQRVAITIAPVFAGGYHAVGPLERGQGTDLPKLTQTTIVPAGADYILYGRLDP